MKIRIISLCRSSAGYALLLVMIITAVSILLLGATLQRTYTVARINDRNSQLVSSQNAAEAATEKVFAAMASDFQKYGLLQVTNSLATYRTYIPNEDSYWSNYEFSDGQGNINRTYVGWISNYTGDLPSQYPNKSTKGAPIFRILSNARMKNARHTMTNAVQEDVLLALVPLSTYAIFYNGLLEFSTCATMIVNGRVHANGPIYVGAGGSSTLTFNDTVTTTSTISAPNNNGSSWPTDWHTIFNGNPTYKTNVPAVNISVPMTNTHTILDLPPPGELASSSNGQVRLINAAQIVMLVSNSSVTLKIQASAGGQLPGQDVSPIILSTNSTPAALTNKFNFLTLLWPTNSFYDQREGKTILATQIDIGKYRQWISTNVSVLAKFPVVSSNYPTILYVSDQRTTAGSQMTAIRLTNGLVLPANGGLGFSVVTPDPLYVLGHYNCTNQAYLGTTNTTTTVPAALMSDALTILSSRWQDSQSTNGYTVRLATNDTVNAALVTGVVKSTGSGNTQFSGGVHNLPRLLEDWNSPSSRTLTLNTSIIGLFPSTKATGQFINPGTYYDPPTRQFSFDPNFYDPAKQPPGIPCALVPIRFNWGTPPPNTVTWNVIP